MQKRVLKHICYFEYQQAWKRLLYLSLINRLITHKIFLQALREASEQLKQRALQRCWGVRCLDSVAVASSPLFSYRVTMFTSLVFSGTSPPSSTGREFGRAWWFQDFCSNTILAGAFSGGSETRAFFRSSSVGSLSRSSTTGLHSMAFLASSDTIFSVSGIQLRVMFNPALHLLHSVLDYPAWSSFKGAVLFWEGPSACLIPSYIYGLDDTCLNTRLNTSTEVKPVFICTASSVSLRITTRRL